MENVGRHSEEKESKLTEERPSNFWEADRLKTFSKWPFGNNCKCSPAKMAEAGFFACGGEREADLAKCFFCKKELDGWEPDDDPWTEHRSHSKKCVFLEYGRAEGDLTVKEVIELAKMYSAFLIERKTDLMLTKCLNELNEILAPLK